MEPKLFPRKQRDLVCCPGRGRVAMDGIKTGKLDSQPADSNRIFPKKVEAETKILKTVAKAPGGVGTPTYCTFLIKDPNHGTFSLHQFFLQSKNP